MVQRVPWVHGVCLLLGSCHTTWFHCTIADCYCGVIMTAAALHKCWQDQCIEIYVDWLGIASCWVLVVVVGLDLDPPSVQGQAAHAGVACLKGAPPSVLGQWWLA